MKKLLPLIVLILITGHASAQGLEDVIVEKYYVSDATDATAPGGTLPEGSITYRIWVDMAPGYVLRSVFCDVDNGHDLRIATTTAFFNNSYGGETTSNAISNTDLPQNTVMLDSWISLGGAASGKIAVMKSEDTDGAVTNSGGFLQNADSRAGDPIKTKDGMINGTPSGISKIGLDGALSVFGTSTTGSVFYANDGTWFNVSGAEGPTAANKVLIAQVTTNGILSYALNFLIVRKSDLKAEEYVHTYAIDNEILCEKCFSNGVPTSISDPGKYFNKADDNNLIFKIFPNPAKDFLRVEYAGAKAGSNNSIRIFNIIGKPVFQAEETFESENYSKEINLFNLMNGVYFLQFSTSDGFKSTRRFIKNQ